MIIKKEWQKFEDEERSKEHLSLEQKLRIIEALYDEAVMLGVFPLKDPLEGIEIDIRIAKVINNVPKAA